LNSKNVCVFIINKNKSFDALLRETLLSHEGARFFNYLIYIYTNNGIKIIILSFISRKVK